MAKNLKEKLDIFLEEKIINQRLEDIVGEAFGRYSKYIIQERALPDVRDGLKPVQRRILFAMYKLGMFSNTNYKKSARIAGEVMGKYHPHGDSSIYEAMVRMSQHWKLRELLIDMHGNNGSIDGDPAAAMRYTEARLSKISEYLLNDIDKRTVSFIPNFDDEEYEPTVLPAKFPNLLVNGATGISAGYATDIPPHNLGEIIDATIYRMKNIDCNLEELLEIVTGPDFPTGGIIQGKSGIKQALKTGKGKVIIRSKIAIENLTKSLKQIVITEIPYDVNKANLVKNIDVIRSKKRIDGINEVRDESDREGLRIAIDLKKDANHEVILKYLYKKTNLQKAYNYNIVAISNKRPVQIGLIGILDAYILHQKEVITNRSNFDLKKALKRIHILEGLIKMLDVLDEVIELIRQSKNKADAKKNIMKSIGFTEEQAEAIVSLQLYRLTTTDITLLNKEFDKLTKLITELRSVLNDENKLKNVIIKELTDVRKEFFTKRKSVIQDEIENIIINETDLISSEDCIFMLTKNGYIKRTSLRSYNEEVLPLIKDGDAVLHIKQVNTLNTALIFTSKGRYVYLPVYKIPDIKWKSLGTHINNIIHLDENEKIINVFCIDSFDNDHLILMSTEKGLVKQSMLKDFKVSRFTKPIRAIKIKDDDVLSSVEIGKDSFDKIISVSKKGYAVKYNQNEVSIVGTQAQGVRSIKLSENDKLVYSKYINENDDLIIFTSRDTVKRIKAKNIEQTLRARHGSRVIKNVRSKPYFINFVEIITEIESLKKIDLTLFTDKGIEKINTKSLKISGNEYGRNVITDKFVLKIEKPIIKIKTKPILKVTKEEKEDKKEIYEQTTLL